MEKLWARGLAHLREMLKAAAMNPNTHAFFEDEEPAGMEPKRRAHRGSAAWWMRCATTCGIWSCRRMPDPQAIHKCFIRK